MSFTAPMARFVSYDQRLVPNQPIQMALMTLDTPLIDDAELEALGEAAAQRHFLLTMNPLRVPGGPVNPIATF